jgi:hypothetical protein
MDGGLVPGLGWVSLDERRRADLFLADLRGRARRRQAYGEDHGEVVQACGFFGPNNVWRTEQEIRAAVVAQCNAEWNAWRTTAGARPECDAGLFGRLVGYYLAARGSILPDTLTSMQAAAVGGINYAPLLAFTATAATIRAEVTRIRGLLLASAPGATAAGLATLVDSAIGEAREAHTNLGSFRAWSAVFVSACVRGAAIAQGLEAVVTPGRSHVGRDVLLLAALAHAAYTMEARARRASGRLGTYHAFRPAERPPQLGDIIVQDRRDDIAPSRLTTLAGLAAGLISHGDIVVEVQPTFVVAIGGNVGDSVRKRRYPRNATGFLVTDRLQLFTQEDDAGVLAAVPVQSCQALADRSTARIFALLSLVERCVAVPDPLPGGAMLATASTGSTRRAPGVVPMRGSALTEELAPSSARPDFFRMPEGPGHHLAMAYCGHQWGKMPVIQLLIRVSEEWHRRYPNRPFGLGDISAEDGAKIGHLSHREGVDFDVYVLRADRLRELVRHGYTKHELVGTDGTKKPGKFRPTTWDHPFYSREWTRELIELFIDTAGAEKINLVIFNDREVVSAVKARSGVRIGTDEELNPGHRVHDDHFHIRLNVP